MKKFLTFVLVLAMVLSVSSFAMADVTLRGSGNEADPYLVKTEEELIAAAAAGGYIRLDGSFDVDEAVPVTGNVNLDLYGNTITGTDTTTKNFGLLTVSAGACLTVDDSVDGGKMTLKATTNSGWGRLSAVIMNNQGTVIIEGGTIQHLGGTDMAYGIDNLTNSNIGDALLVVKGGTIEGTYAAIRLSGNCDQKTCTCRVEDGVIQGGKFGFLVHDTNSKHNNIDLDITKGTVTGTNAAMYVWEADGNRNTDGIDVDVFGGVFNAPFQFGIPDVAGTGDASVSSIFTISGGIFSEEPAAALLADGSYTAEITEDGDTASAGETTRGFVVGKDEGSLKDALKDAVEELIKAGKDPEKLNVVVDTPDNTPVDFNTGDLPGGVIVDGEVTVNGVRPSGGLPMPTPELPQVTNKPSSGSGISVKYNGSNSFSTSNPAVPTGVEIDGVPVTFNGTGSNFSVGCISSDAKWVTVRWNSTSVTTNFTPDGLVECTTVNIPKTGDMSFWAAVAAFFGF